MPNDPDSTGDGVSASALTWRALMQASGINSGVPLRVLTVARWYPSHDSPGRGSFVADLVRATVAAGVDARVASFDRVLIRGRIEWRDADRAPARRAFDLVATPAALFATPVSYGAPGVPVARIPVVRRPGSGDVAALVEDHLDALRPFLLRLVETWVPDVIHAHTGLPDGVVAAMVGRELGIPVVVSEHASTIESELADPLAIEYYRTLLEPGVRLAAVSPPLASRMASAIGVAAERIEILPDPVAEAAFPPADASGRSPNDLLWVGSLGDHKGIDVLLRAFAHLHGERPELRLRLVGGERSPGEQARWEALGADLGVGSAVTLTGWRPRDQVANAMATAAVFVHPSPSETFGVAAAEAILTGLPVAARQSGGVPWIIELSGGYGRVADGDSPEAFAAAIAAVLQGGLPVDAATARERLIDAIGEAAVARRAIDVYRGSIAPAVGETRAAAAIPSVAPRALADLPRVVLATGRDQARRLVSELPVELQERLILVLPAPIGEVDTPGKVAASAVRVVEAEPVPPPRPRPRGRSPLARLRRAVFRPAPTADDLLATAIAAAGRATGGGSGPVEIVAIDAPAVAFVARLDARRARLAPGSLRWLADRWDAAATRRP
jgi:glycosyltransferase involved in cell wall biosynthesis